MADAVATVTCIVDQLAWISFVNAPIGLVTAILALRLLDHDRDIGFGRGVHVLGAVLITSALMLLVYTIVKPAAESGWASGRTLALLAFVIAAGLCLRRSRLPSPSCRGRPGGRNSSVGPTG